jgi:hypothetical protein
LGLKLIPVPAAIVSRSLQRKKQMTVVRHHTLVCGTIAECCIAPLVWRLNKS